MDPVLKNQKGTKLISNNKAPNEYCPRIASQSRPVKVRIERSNDINELLNNIE
jgi:hypothetical protein